MELFMARYLIKHRDNFACNAFELKMSERDKIIERWRFPY
jgi:hypothetical protein